MEWRCGCLPIPTHFMDGGHLFKERAVDINGLAVPLFFDAHRIRVIGNAIPFLRLEGLVSL